MTESVREGLIVSLAVGTYIVAVSEANCTCVEWTEPVARTTETLRWPAFWATRSQDWDRLF